MIRTSSARCATLLPLLEVGAAAGLCLLPDRDAYDYDGHRVPARLPAAAATPTFACRPSPSTPLPDRPVEVAWRAGLDLEPIDVHEAEQMGWLEALVWPGEGARLELLRAAVNVARADPPRVVRGDLRDDLTQLAAQAPTDATLVVFHTAVLAYVLDPRDRIAFADTVGALDAVWVANESPGLFRDAALSHEPWPIGRFLLTQDGRPMAWTDSHGTAIDWLA